MDFPCHLDAIIRNAVLLLCVHIASSEGFYRPYIAECLDVVYPFPMSPFDEDSSASIALTSSLVIFLVFT